MVFILRNIFLSTLLLVIILVSSTLQAEEEELANIAVLDFIDSGKSEHYNWLSTSIPEAIDKSMGRMFLYNKVDKEDARDTAYDVGHEGSIYSDTELADIADELNANLIIYGNFVPIKGANKFKIQAKLYSTFDKKVVGEVTETSPTDSKLFKVNERVAAKMVKLIVATSTGDAKSKLAAGEKLNRSRGKGNSKKNVTEDKIAIQGGLSALRKLFPGRGMYGVALMSVVPGAASDSYFDPGFGIRFDAVHKFIWRWFQPQLTFGFTGMNETRSGRASGVLFFNLGAGYTFRINRQFKWRPFVTAGVHNSLREGGYTVVDFEGGVTGYYFFNRRLAATLTVSGIYYNDIDRPLLFDSFAGGVAYRY